MPIKFGGSFRENIDAEQWWTYLLLKLEKLPEKLTPVPREIFLTVFKLENLGTRYSDIHLLFRLDNEMEEYSLDVIKKHMNDIFKKFYLTKSKIKDPEKLQTLVQLLVNEYSNQYNNKNKKVTNINIKYLPRPPLEEECIEIIKQPGSLLRIKASSKMGKTLLITNWLLPLLEKDSYKTVYLNSNDLDEEDIANKKQFFWRFCEFVTIEMGLEVQPDIYKGGGDKSKCTTYFEKYLLSKVNTNLVLCIDDLDLIFEHEETCKDFLSMLRTWHENAKRRPLLKKLRLVLVHSTEVYVEMEINQSPFNVGISKELRGLTEEQVQLFAFDNGVNLDDAQAKLLNEMIGGHPYLVQQAIEHLRNPENQFENFLIKSPTLAGIYKSHLLKLVAILENHPKMATEFKKVVTANANVKIDELEGNQLYRLGLVHWEGNNALPSYKLYHKYFAEYFA